MGARVIRVQWKPSKTKALQNVVQPACKYDGSTHSLEKRFSGTAHRRGKTGRKLAPRTMQG